MRLVGNAADAYEHICRMCQKKKSKQLWRQVTKRQKRREERAWRREEEA